MAAFNITAPLSPFRAVGRNGSGASIKLESITRPSAGERVLQEALARVPAVDNSGDADFSIGKAARFTLTTPDQKTNPGGGTVTWPPDDPANDPKDGVVVDDFDYVDRSVELIRVTQKDEPDNYVIVERALKYLFIDRKTGRYKRFNFDFSKKPSETQDHSGG